MHSVLEGKCGEDRTKRERQYPVVNISIMKMKIGQKQKWLWVDESSEGDTLGGNISIVT